MRKFEVYWNISHDKFGGERRYPMMVVSTEEANEKSQFVTAIRITNFEKYQSRYVLLCLVSKEPQYR